MVGGPGGAAFGAVAEDAVAGQGIGRAGQRLEAKFSLQGQGAYCAGVAAVALFKASKDSQRSFSMARLARKGRRPRAEGGRPPSPAVGDGRRDPPGMFVAGWGDGPRTTSNGAGDQRRRGLTRDRAKRG